MLHLVSIGPHRLFLGDAYAIRPALGWMDADVMDPPFLFNAKGAGNMRKARITTRMILDCQHRDKNGPGTGLKRGQLG